VRGANRTRIDIYIMCFAGGGGKYCYDGAAAAAAMQSVPR